ncbi:DUF1702 family protein [Micromonospora sp. FIMYZ51]|uniref:DUF1702 family protein n=1 Tax=Micromonospora sp. FIMYZ51 TaxID=3051832 RepID=UPI00311EBEAC
MTTYDFAPGRPLKLRGWRRLLYQSDELADFGNRGFRTTPVELRHRLETVARTFLGGFNAGLATPGTAPPLFTDQPAHLRGFAVEGLAMQASLMDLLVPGRRRLPRVVEAHGPHHTHLVHVGVGWALAKLRRPGWIGLHGLDPLLRWLALDGWGFATGFFADARGLRQLTLHQRRCSDRCAIRYQGLGRSMWFRGCGSPIAVADLVDALPAWHHGDAWSGVGLAVGYAGGADADALRVLRERAGRHCPDLGQGAAFAAAAWRRSGGSPAPLAATVQTFAGTDVDTAADWTVEAESGLRAGQCGPGEYQVWRQRIRARAQLAAI